MMALGDLPAMLRSAADQGLAGGARARAGRRAGGGLARRQPRPHGRAPRRAARGADRRGPPEDRALDHASQPGLGAAGGARAAARRTGSPERWAPPPSAARSRQAIRWSSDYLRVPLKLVTGPANAAKAGEVLGGLRARLDDDPILVVPTFSDVEHSQRELAERGAVFGARVMRFDWLFARDRRPRRLRRPPGVRLPARADRGGRGAARAAPRARRVGRPARLRACRGALRDRAQPLHGRAGPLDPGAPRLGRRRPAAGLRGGGRRRVPRLPRRRWRPRTWSTRSCSRGGRRRPARANRAWGGDAAVRVWLRRLHAARAPGARHDRELVRGGCDGLAALRAGTARVQGRVRDAPGAAGARRRGARACARSTTTTRPSRARRSTTSSACLFEDEPGRRVQPGSAIAFHSAGGERAEVELAGARVLQLLRDGVEPGDVAVVFRDPVRYSSLARAGLRRLRDPVLDRPQAAVRPHRPRARSARAHPRGGPRRQRRRPAHLPAHARAPAGARVCRQPRGRGAKPRRAQRRRRPRVLGARPLAARRARPPRAGARHRRIRRGARGAARAAVRRPLRAHGHRSERPAARGGARAQRGPARSRGAPLGARRRGASTRRTCSAC